jgi:hypothetical protein
MNKFTTCPDCDEDLLLTAIDEDQNCTTYEIEDSEVSDIFIRPDGAPDIFASWSTTPTYVADSVDNTVTDNTASKWLVGIGNVAVANKTETPYPKGKMKVTVREYPLVMRISNLSDAMYNFLRKFQGCGWLGWKFYYVDKANKLYGIAGGLEPSFVDVDFPLAEGGKKEAILTIRFKADQDPERRTSPYTGTGA